MPRYRFVGSSETVMSGLSHAVNATLHREEHGQPDESTVVAQYGDEITTAKPYPHALMLELCRSAETGEWVTKEYAAEHPATTVTEKKPRKPRAPRNAPAPPAPSEPTLNQE